jgi:uncharacterized protein (TIGR02266 family)
MNQDTRKDPRAKVLTMTVRYKSATLDEFIEHHSYDVSRGGMFIKTPSPFPPGTLLKFEVKIADEQRLMQGVGRVVWKRESNDSNDTRPSGMGVKFIKIDDESRRTIERLVEVRGDGANAFDQGSAPRLPVATVAAAAGSTSSPAPAKPAEPRSRKSTVIGLGAMKPSGGSARAVNISSGPPRVMAPAPEKLHAEPFFPKSDFKAEMPALEDQTMMKQAKELLADALRHAGGTPEDVKAAAKVSSIPPHVPRPEPHRSVPPRPAKRESEPMQPVKRSPFSDHPGEDPDGETTIWRANEAAALLAESMRDSIPPQGEEVHGRITARPPSESGESGRPGFRESEPATAPGNSPGSEAASPAVKPVEESEGDEPESETEAPPVGDAPIDEPKPLAKPLEAEPARAASKAEVAAKRDPVKAPVSAPPASERASSRSRASQAMLEAARETSEGGGGGKGVFALVALAAAAGITFYLMRPAPAPLPEPPPAEPAKVEPAREVAPSTPALIVSTPDPTSALSAAPADSASAAPSAVAAPSASAAPVAAAAAEVSEKPVVAKPVRKYVPRRVPKQKVDPAPAEGTPPASDTPPPTPPAEAAPEPPPPAPPPAPPTPTPPPLGDNPY